jgi:hypothetical protein
LAYIKVLIIQSIIAVVTVKGHSIYKENGNDENILSSIGNRRTIMKIKRKHPRVNESFI